MNYDNDLFGGFNEVEDMPSLEEFEALAQEEQTPAEETEETEVKETPNESAKPSEKKEETPQEKFFLEQLNKYATTDTQFAEALRRSDKNIHECFEYMTAKANEMVVERKGAQSVGVDGMTMIGWAVHYYTEPKAVIDAELHPKAKATTKQEAKKAPAKKPAFSPTLTAKKSSHDPADSDKMKKMQKLLQLSLFN